MIPYIFWKSQNNELHMTNLEAFYANNHLNWSKTFFARAFGARDVIACTLGHGRAKIWPFLRGCISRVI